MARNYILGGMGATQLQAGKPYFKRITRKRSAAETVRADGLTCAIVVGKIRFDALNGKSVAWNATADHEGGELLMVEFPTTLRSVQIQMEEATVGVRAKIMLTAPGQNVKADGTETLAQPVANGNYIEIKSGETATISSRTKVVFILIQRYETANIFDGNGDLTTGVAGAETDVASILVTGVLDHEPTSGGSQAANEPNSIIVPATGPERELRQIWGKGDGVG
jgi:hypothetical protein